MINDYYRLLVSTILPPDLQHQEVILQLHRSVNGIAAGENIPPSWHTVLQSVYCTLTDALSIALHKGCAVHVSNQADPISNEAFHLGDVHTCYRVN